jgi:hypothetical protein
MLELQAVLRQPTHHILLPEPEIPIARFDIQAAFRTRMNIFESGILRYVATIFCNHLAVTKVQKIVAPIKSSCKVVTKVQKIVAPINQHITCCSIVATIFCNHLAKLLQKNKR